MSPTRALLGLLLALGAGASAAAETLVPRVDAPAGARAWLPGGAIHGLAFSPGGEALAVGLEGEVLVVEAGTGRVLSRQLVEPGPTRVTYLPSGELVVGAAREERWVRSPDQRLDASGGRDRVVRLVESTDEEVGRLVGPGGWITALAFDAPGDRLFVGSDDNWIWTYAVASGELLGRLPGHRAWVGALAASPDGAWLASGGGDAALLLRHAESGRVRRRLDGHFGAVHALAFSPDSTWLVSGGEDRTLLVWDLEALGLASP